MICFPNAKINLGLHITGKRADGYHDIETVFYPIPVKDALEIVAAGAGADSFSQTGIPVAGTPSDNLVMKALRLLREAYPVPPLEIHLHKAIPFGAGLGGGSADAAWMLKSVNDFCQLRLSDSELERLATSIGADCPFFIRNTPVFAGGTGNRFAPVELSLKGYHLCLVKPGVAVSTREAYAMSTPALPAVSLREIIRLPPSEWRNALANDFEASISPRYPLIADIKKKLYRHGAIYAALSGSGSSVFGLFDERTCLKEAFPDCFVWEGELVDHTWKN